MDRLHSMSRERLDPFGEITVDVCNSVTPEFIDSIRAADCGVIIWLAGCQDPDVDFQGVAEHGVFTVRLGDRNRVIPFWDEVADGSATSNVTIFWHDRSFTEGRAVRKVETSTTQGMFLTTNAEQPLVGAIQMLAALCLDIQRGGPRFEEQLRRLTPEPLDTSAGHDCPSNLDAAKFVLSKLARSAYLRWKTRGRTPKWFVALRSNLGDSITDPAQLDLTRFKEVPLPAGVEAMADPFLWETDDAQYLLFEELTAGQPRGRLGCVELLPNGRCSEMTVVLERPYHLSYPCVVPSDGDLPERKSSVSAGPVLSITKKRNAASLNRRMFSD